VRPPFHREPGLLQFFGSLVGAEERLQKEAFFLAYHLHWGYADVMDMATGERWEFVRMLAAQLEREQESLERARHR
jgi:hypothetical protein